MNKRFAQRGVPRSEVLGAIFSPPRLLSYPAATLIDRLAVHTAI